MNEISGFLLINKPQGITSFACVNHVRRLLPKKTKVGHSGTLDKEASGLLIICISRKATKVIDELLNIDKHYKVKAKFGELTTTLDYSGEIIETVNYKDVTEEQIISAIDSIGTQYKQTPPVYSALKHQGKSLYKLARSKKIEPSELEKIVLKKSRMVEIYKLELLEFKLPYFTFYAHVSKGTYIRSLANDIASKINNYATTYDLVRTGIGNISLSDCVNFEEIQNLEDIKAYLKTIEEISNLLNA